MTNDSQARQKVSHRFQWLYIVPLSWISIGVLGLAFPGGENITIGVALMPGFIVGKCIGFDLVGNLDFSSRNAIVYPLLGVFPLLIVGLLLDLARVQKRGFVIALGVGLAVVFSFIAGGFIKEMMASGYARAASHFDFDQPPRVVAMGVFVLAGGFYLSLPLALLAAIIARFLRR